MRLRPALTPVTASPLHGVFGPTVAPDGAILHWDANQGTTELTRNGHDFQSLVLGNQYQLQADGSTVNIGATMPVDTIDGEKWLRSCGAVTNIFGGDTSQARSASLTSGTVYTLQVFGAGTVSCSYGTATVASPLKITATATAAVTFTPSGATSWMLTATAYPVPYVPPGVTQPATNATATNGAWFKLLDGSELWKALDGQADGVELVTNGWFDADVSGFTAGANGPLTWESSFSGRSGVAKITNTGITSAITTKTITTVVGARYRVSLYAYAPSSNTRVKAVTAWVTETAGSQVTISAEDVWQALSFDFVASGASTVLNFRAVAAGGLIAIGYVAYLDNISIQRIQPQPLTLATRVRMGVGSGDLPNGTGGLNLLRPNGSGGSLAYYEKTATPTSFPMGASDGASYPSAPPSAWARNATLRCVTQVNTAGTQFRVGYMIEGTHTAIQWSAWTAFDGSFNPSTLYRLMLGYNNVYPIWFNKITAWRKQVSDAEIMEALS